MYVSQVYVTPESPDVALPSHTQQALYDAVHTGRSDVTQHLVRCDVILDALDPGGNTCLGRAVQLGHVDIVKILLQAGADVNKSDFYCQTPIQYTADTNDVTSANILISAGANVNWNTDGLSGLHIAACKGNTEVIKVLLEAGADPSAKDRNDVSVLHCAVGNGHLDIVRLLLAARADINVSGGTSNRTPLFMAVDVDDARMVTFLLKNGAKVNTQDNFGLTALCGACRQNYGKVARMLVDANARVNMADDDGSLPLHYAARNGDVGLVDLLTQAGSDVNVLNSDGFGPLHLAMRNAHVDIIRLLVKRGADPNLRHPADDKTCTHTAVDAIRDPAIFETVVQMLLTGGANLDIISDDRTALWRATDERKEAIAVLLVQYGANPNVEGPHGITVLHQACRLGLQTLVHTLLHAGIDWRGEGWLHVDAYSTGISPDLLAGYTPGVPVALHDKLPLLCAISSVRGSTLSLQHIARLALRTAARSTLYRLINTPHIPPALRDFVLLKVL